MEAKADASPVSIADREAEAEIRRLLRAARPADGWLGEETGTESGSSGRRWIVDPIDGTRNFVRGIPLWSTLVACVDGPEGDERVLAAAAGFPALGEWYDAGLGLGARQDGTAIRVSAVQELAQAGFGYYTYEQFRKHGYAALFTAFSGACALARGGGDAYMHVLVASGRLDLCVEAKLAPWDLAATSLIVAEAGGRVTGFDGRGGLRAGNGDVVLSNGHLHEAALVLIRSTRKV